MYTNKEKVDLGAAAVQQSQHRCGKLDPTILSNVSALLCVPATKTNQII